MDIQEQFNNVSEKYDSQRKILIPCFQDFYNIAVENIDFKSSDIKILDLGAGTGLFSQKVLEKYPNADITLVDFSSKMLDVAQIRFNGLSNVNIIHDDVTKYKIDNQQYDAVISSLAIHHLEDLEKKELYKRIFNGLKNNGVFVNAEQISGEDSFTQKLYHKRWCDKIEHSTLTRSEIDAAYERIKLDKRTPLNTQLEWLKDIGFHHVDCLYKYYDFAVIWAIKQHAI